jgi:hypothetical protein
VQRADDLECLDRVVRVLPLKLGEHRRDVPPVYPWELRDDGRGGGEPALSDEHLGVQNLFIKRSGNVEKWHVVSPLAIT